MRELWLNFKNENGLLKRVLVEGQKFTVGRTSDNDLCVPFPELSRRHIQIERFDDSFIVSDAGSSNGTTLNEIELLDPVELKNGHRLNLGGGLEINVEIVSNSANKSNAENNIGADPANGIASNENNLSAPAASVSSTAAASSASGGNSIPFGFFILAPLLVFFVLAIVGVIIFVSRKDDPTIAAKNSNLIYTSQPDNEDDEDINSSSNKDEDDKPTPTPIANSSLPSNNTNSTSSPEPTETPSNTKVSDDTDKIERASVSFLRRIAAGGSRAFLTGKQIAVVSPKLNQFKGSSALAENLKNAKQNSAQIEELARSKICARSLSSRRHSRSSVISAEMW